MTRVLYWNIEHFTDDRNFPDTELELANKKLVYRFNYIVDTFFLTQPPEYWPDIIVITEVDGDKDATVSNRFRCKYGNKPS